MTGSTADAPGEKITITCLKILLGFGLVITDLVITLLRSVFFSYSTFLP